MVKKKILLIDDEEDFCYSVKVNLERTKEFEVITATCAEDGIRLARKEQPDLILLDIRMPGMAGDQVATVLSDDLKTKEIPIIFLTAIVLGEIELGTMERIGGQDFIAKPVETKDLIRCIKKVI